MNSPLKISNLSKSFKKHLVLDDISLEVESGDIFGLIGLNGAGKTTMIKIILGLLDADKGEAKIFDKNSNDKEARKNLSFLPEKFHPSNFLKGKEFLALTCSYYNKKFDFNRAKELATILRLNPDVLNNRVSSYSKGMGQKLGLLSSLLVDCPFLMLDEPMSGLDPISRISLKDALTSYASSHTGNTIFFSSHILSDIDEICNKIAVLHNSKIIYFGSPTDFKEEQKENNLERAFLKAIE
jgi:ABC-2 type transport system ATP-binding protein